MTKSKKTYHRDARDRVLNHMTVAWQATPLEVASATGLTQKAAQVMMSKLAKQGALSHPRHGAYALASASAQASKSNAPVAAVAQKLEELQAQRRVLDRRISSLEDTLDMFGVKVPVDLGNAQTAGRRLMSRKV